MLVRCAVVWTVLVAALCSGLASDEISRIAKRTRWKEVPPLKEEVKDRRAKAEEKRASVQALLAKAERGDAEIARKRQQEERQQFEDYVQSTVLPSLLSIPTTEIAVFLCKSGMVNAERGGEALAKILQKTPGVSWSGDAEDAILTCMDNSVEEDPSDKAAQACLKTLRLDHITVNEALLKAALRDSVIGVDFYRLALKDALRVAEVRVPHPRTVPVYVSNETLGLRHAARAAERDAAEEHMMDALHGGDSTDLTKRFDYGPDNIFLDLVGRCVRVEGPINQEAVDSPREICFYRSVRYQRFTSYCGGLGWEGSSAVMMFNDPRLVSDCAARGGHRTSVRLSCGDTIKVLKHRPLSDCWHEVSVATPHSCHR